MKIILSIFIVVLTIPIASIGQMKVTKADLKEITALSRDGKSDMALARIKALRDSVTVHDSIYVYLIGISEQINATAYNCEEAIKDNEEMIRLSPSSEGDARERIGRYRAIMGQFDSAIVAYSRALKLNKRGQGIYANLAYAYNSAGRYRDAIRALSRPDAIRHPQEYYQYAVAYFNLNRVDSARLYIDRLFDIANTSTDFQAYKLAAQIYATVGDRTKSCELIIKSNDIIDKTKVEEEIQKASPKKKSYYYVKQMLKEIDKARELKTKLCE